MAKPCIDTFAIPSAGNKTTFNIEIPIDFALIRNQISYFSAILPAQLLDSVELLITWGSPSDLMTTVNDTEITDATKVNVGIVEVYENTTDTKELDDIIKKAEKVYEGVQQTILEEAHASFPADELPIQVRPVPAQHLTAILFALNNITDGNASYDNAVIDQIRLDNVKSGGEAIFHDYFAYLNRQQKLDYKLPNGSATGGVADSPDDIVILDWADLRNGSLDNMDVDALKYKILNPAPSSGKNNALRIYKKYIVRG